MIKVNLLKSKVGDGTTAMHVGPASMSSDNADVREALIKIAVLLMFTTGLMFYESQNLHTLQAEQAKLQAQVTETEAQAAAKAKEVEAVKDVEAQARELADKLKSLKLLSKLRLREVKTLDFVQSSIPEKVWLKTVNYEAAKDNIELGHFNFTGNAASTEDLTEFVKRLEDSAYLYEVIVMKNLETPVQNQKAMIREFQFTAQVEIKR